MYKKWGTFENSSAQELGRSESECGMGPRLFAFLCKLCLFVFIVGLNKHASGELNATCTSDEIMNRFARASVCVFI